MNLIEKFRLWKANRNLLIINFGTTPGRVPLILLSRDGVNGIERKENRISFGHSNHIQNNLRITVILKDSSSAAELLKRLEKKKEEKIEAFDPVITITLYRSDYISQDSTAPVWIAGDFNETEEKLENYSLSGNRAYIHKQYKAEPVAAGQRR